MNCVYSICSLSNISQAELMFDSIAEDVKKILFLIDERRDLPATDFGFDIMDVSAILPEIHAELVKMYNAFEVCCALKPILGKYLAENHSFSAILYADTDVMFFDQLNPFLDQLEQDFLITPHFYSSPKGYEKISELEVNLSGLYNGGFFCFRPTPQVVDMLKWWSTKTIEVGFNRTEAGMFVDQIWLNYFPIYFDHVQICRQQEVNVAYWNLHERKIELLGENFLVNGKRLFCFHFSGFRLHRPDLISIHQTQHSFENHGDLKSLFKLYYEKWKNSTHSKYDTYSYTYSDESFSVKTKKRLRAKLRNIFKNENPLR